MGDMDAMEQVQAVNLPTNPPRSNCETNPARAWRKSSARVPMRSPEHGSSTTRGTRPNCETNPTRGAHLGQSRASQATFPRTGARVLPPPSSISPITGSIPCDAIVRASRRNPIGNSHARPAEARSDRSGSCFRDPPSSRVTTSDHGTRPSNRDDHHAPATDSSDRVSTVRRAA